MDGKPQTLNLGVPSIVIQDATPLEGDIENLTVGMNSEDESIDNPENASEEFENGDLVKNTSSDCGQNTDIQDMVSKHSKEQFKDQSVNASVDVNNTEAAKETTPADYAAAQSEWENVETVTPGAATVTKSESFISFEEALSCFRSRDLKEELSQIKPTVHRNLLGRIRHFLFGTRLRPDLHNERNFVFALGICSFDNEQSVHIRILQTVYRQLTGDRVDCPRYGSHWEQIGFQGNDPVTDLRGMGMLGLLTALAFTVNDKTLLLAKDIYTLSHHETQNFPFFVMSINITRIAVQALREDCLNKECNRQHDVMSALNTFYMGTFLHLYQIWKLQHKTIKDSGFVLKEVECYAKKNPKQIMRNLHVHLSGKTRRSPSAQADTQQPNSDGTTGVVFSNVCEVKAESETANGGDAP